MSYCTKNDINALFGDISDDISDEMFSTVIDNCTAWIESNQDYCDLLWCQ